MAKITTKLIVDLDGVERVLKGIKNVDTSLFAVGSDSIVELKENWISGKGGDGKRWKGEFLEHSASELSEEYKIAKVEAGGDPIPNMSLTGKMQQSMRPKKLGRNQVDVTFAGAKNKKKAAANHENRPNMFKLSKKFKDKMVEFVRKRIFPF